MCAHLLNNLKLMIPSFLGALFFFSDVALSANSPQQNFAFECVTLDQGLSQSTVASILQDKSGYIWFGTIDGLNKYDGYNFTVYRNDPNDSTSIADNWITWLCLSEDSTVWIGTLSRGLCKFDSKTKHFSNYRFNPIPIDSPERQRLLAELPFTLSYLNYFTISAIFEDSFGSLWIGTFGSGLYKFDREREVFIHYPFVFDQTNDLAYNIMSITETVQNGTGTLWIGTFGGGLIKFREQQGFMVFKHDPHRQNSLINDRIITVFADTLCNEDVLWIGTFGGGLDKFDVDTGKFIHFTNDPDNPNSICSNYVLSILKDRCNELWVGTFDAGLNRIELVKDRYTCYQHDPKNVNSLGSNEVLSLFEDRSEILWIGTNLGYGINKFNRRRNNFTHYFHDPSDGNTLSENVVFSLLEDQQGILWIGTFQTGLNRFDRDRNELINYRHDPGNPNSISDNHLRAIFEDSQGRLWIGTFCGGLNYFDRKKNRFIHYKHNPSNSKSISSNQVRSIYEDEFGNLWIAAFGGGLDKFDPVTGIFTHYRHDPDNPNSLSDNQAYYITGDSAGCLWIATFGGGVDLFDIKTEHFTHLRHNPVDENSIGDDRILTIYLDRYDTNLVWFGSFGRGFNRLDKRSRQFIHYTMKDGLPNNVVYSILPDNHGCLWMSTNKGLSKFNPRTETFVNYDLLDGLQSNEFNAGAYYKSRITGEMFFGGVNGLNCIDPDKIDINEQIPSVVITSFKIFAEEKSHEFGPMTEGREIVLSYKENFFSLEFAVLDYTDVAKNQFAYKLEGVDEDWIFCGNRHYVNYTNLDPGNYIFKVKGSNCDGVWNHEGTSVKLKIKPRFYQTRYWHPTVVGILILLIITYFMIRTKLKIRRSLELERVRMLEKEQVQKTIATDFHDELGQKLTRISLFSEIIRGKLAKESVEFIDYINKINKAAKELSSSTRDFIWTLNPGQDSLYDVAIYLKDFGDELFDKTGVEFRVDGISKNLESIQLPMEWRRHLILIFKEAMNNVIKHAECKGLILEIKVNHDVVEISLSDNGTGCLNGKRNGQGLHNMKQRAELIHGHLDINFEKGKGTTVRFYGEIPRMGY